MNLFSQNSYLFRFQLSEEEKWNVEGHKSFSSLLLQGGVGYSFTLKTFTKDRDTWNYTRIGFYPEVNGYFNPRVYRKFITDEGEKIKAPSSTQWSRGVGGGILYGSWKMYLVLKYECNNIDNLKSIGRVVEDLEKDDQYNHVVSLVFVFR